MNTDVIQWAPVVLPSGWQCPCCKAVFAPNVTMCSYCNPSAQLAAMLGVPLTHYCTQPPPKITATTITTGPCAACGKSPCDRSKAECGTTIRMDSSPPFTWTNSEVSGGVTTSASGVWTRADS